MRSLSEILGSWYFWFFFICRVNIFHSLEFTPRDRTKTCAVEPHFILPLVDSLWWTWEKTKTNLKHSWLLSQVKLVSCTGSIICRSFWLPCYFYAYSGVPRLPRAGYGWSCHWTTTSAQGPFFLHNPAERNVELWKPPPRSRYILLAVSKEIHVVVHIYRGTYIQVPTSISDNHTNLSGWRFFSWTHG